MTQIRSSLSPRAPEYQASANAMAALVAELRATVETLSQGGGQAGRRSGDIVARPRPVHHLRALGQVLEREAPVDRCLTQQREGDVAVGVAGEEALGHVRNQWSALTRFVEDARLKLDNNAAERQLRRVAVGRKNWLFADSDEGAERACVIYSLLATCKLHGVNPFDYLRDVLMRLPTHPLDRLAELLPDHWKAARAADSS